MQITTADAAIIASSITATGWAIAAKWQRSGSRTSERIEEAIVAQGGELAKLGGLLTAHTVDDARNFAQLRDSMPSRRRRGWLVPALGLLLRLFV